MAKKAADHLFMANTDAGGYALVCAHCGDVYVPALPISIDGFLAISKSFGKEHKACRAPVGGAFPVDLLLMRANVRAWRARE